MCKRVRGTERRETASDGAHHKSKNRFRGRSRGFPEGRTCQQRVGIQYRARNIKQDLENESDQSEIEFRNQIEIGSKSNQSTIIRAIHNLDSDTHPVLNLFRILTLWGYGLTHLGLLAGSPVDSNRGRLKTELATPGYKHKILDSSLIKSR